MDFLEITDLSEMETILEIKGITKSFDGLVVLDKACCSVQEGTISAFFGENGSGKTTLFHIISGFMKADAGEIFYKQLPLAHSTPAGIAHLGIGRVWQNPRICKNLSVLDNLMLASRNHPGEFLLNYFLHPFRIDQEEKMRRKIAVETAEQIALSEYLLDSAGALSFGQQKLLSIGMLLINEATLLLLDEPFAGVNAKMIERISEVMIKLKVNGKTIMMIEHNRAKAKIISDTQFFVTKGKVIEESITKVHEVSRIRANDTIEERQPPIVMRAGQLKPSASHVNLFDHDIAAINGVFL